MFSLHYRELWSAVSGFLTDELDQMAASAQARWGTQHNTDGTHGDVTTGALASTSVRLSDVFVYDVPAATNTSSSTPGVALELPRKVSALYLKGPIPSGGAYRFGVWAIHMPDAQEGDVLTVFRVSTGPLLISSAFCSQPGGALSPYYTAGNRIALDPGRTTPDSSDAVNYFDAWDINVTGVTLLRVNNYDYDDLAQGLRFPAWVQIG